MGWRIISVMVGLGARKITKTIITPGLGDNMRGKAKGARGCVCVILEL